jgi:cytochrome oxidase Cu insertion factor (SCO1/SenC/PrrC family)
VPGMNSGLDPSDPTLEAAFRSALLHQGYIAVAVVVLLWLIWGTSKIWVPEQAAQTAGPRAMEPAGRRVLRVGFGLLWLFDGILQAQPKMPGGLPSQVIEPAAQASPRWVQDLVNAGGTIWSDHPITAAAASVWVQVGIGLWLLVAPRGRWSRAAGLASVAWGLVVWAWGESFGGIFAPGLSWLTGAPGAVLLYCVAGALIALPPRAWATARTGRLLLAGAGAFFAGMAVLQAWPGRGYWQGTSHGQPGPLAGMVAGMAQTSQPHVLSATVGAFGAFDEAHGFAVNLFVVIVLAATGTALLSGRRRLIRAALIAATVLCLADWVLVQDFGFFGGLGTDPNSMIPTLLLLAGGYLALTRVAVADQPSTADPAATEAQPEPVTAAAAGGNWRSLPWRERVRTAVAAVSVQTVAALGAVAVVVIGAAPMAAASVNGTADPILAEAIAGYSPSLDTPASPFRLTDQHGRAVTLASLRGKTVLLTFLDPVCTSDCPLIAQEFKAAGAQLGSADSQVELVAVVANPTYYGVQFTQAFDQQEGLSAVPNWLYLTGSLSQLRQIWATYGVDVQDLPAGAMSAHNDLAFVIDRTGIIRQEISDDPGPGTTSTQSSFGALLAGDAREALSQ